MMDWERTIKTISAGSASLLTFALGEPDLWLQFLLVMVAADYCSGVAAAWIHHEVSSKRGFEGFLKKLMYLFIVCVAHVIDEVTGAGGVMRNLTIGFFIANEGISVLENGARCGLPIPKKLMDALEQIKGEDEKDDNESNEDETE